ncbi:MAG: hypothetical protein ABIK62_07510, partial [candidate division WOR-3 bacterium]
MSIPNLLLLLLTGLVFPAIALGAFRRPGAGVGILLMSLPVLNLARRFFAEPPVPYPSLETFAVLLLWVCVQIVQSRRSLIPVQPHRSQVHVPTIVALTLFLLAGLASSLVAREPTLSLKILFTGGVVPILIY